MNTQMITIDLFENRVTRAMRIFSQASDTKLG